MSLYAGEDKETFKILSKVVKAKSVSVRDYHWIFFFEKLNFSPVYSVLLLLLLDSLLVEVNKAIISLVVYFFYNLYGAFRTL